MPPSGSSGESRPGRREKMAEKQKIKRVEYTKEMNKAGYTILIPSIQQIFQSLL